MGPGRCPDVSLASKQRRGGWGWTGSWACSEQCLGPKGPAHTDLSGTFQNLPLHIRIPRRGPTTPALRRHSDGLGSSPVARHYWGNHCCFLFLEVLRCFSSLRSPPYQHNKDNCPSGSWVVPFGNPRVKGHLHLTAAYRSLSRPSSPP